MSLDDDFSTARRAGLVNLLLYDTTGGRRFTQDSPVLSNVWQAYANNPRGQQKLILTLGRNKSAGKAAQELRKMLAAMRERLADPDVDDDGRPDCYCPTSPFGTGQRERPRIAYISGQVSAELYFDEMMRLVLPLTPWWETTRKMLRRAEGSKDGLGVMAANWSPFPLPMDDQKRDLMDGLRLIRRERMEEMGSAGGSEMEGKLNDARKRYIGRLPTSLFWLMRIAGVIGNCFDRNREMMPRDPVKLSDDEREVEDWMALDMMCQDARWARRSLTDSQQEACRSLTPERLQGMHEALVQTFGKLYEHWTRPVAPGSNTYFAPSDHFVWRVSLNRPVELAVRTSALTVKADAARRLFDVSCKHLTWAVIDSGIDKDHPAFWDTDTKRFDERRKAALDEGEEMPSLENVRLPSRVVKTLDFTTLRDLLDTELIASLPSTPPGEQIDLDQVRAGEFRDGVQALRQKLLRRQGPLDDPNDAEALARAYKEVDRDLMRLRDRVRNGRDVNWQDLEPLIEHKDAPAPENDHGTHVAGILGGDWIDTDFEEDEHDFPLHLRTRVLKGVCPDIRLIDVRVFREDGKTDEFEILAALQYLRWMNSRAGYMEVQGANLSLSLIHEVRRFACGQTPICEECDEAVATGMVIVAAAGNRGFEADDVNQINHNDGFRSSTITDPGNAEKVITVGATHRKRPHEYGVSYFSSRGPTGDGRQKPDLVAPGEKIDGPTPGDTMKTMDGTSMAAPHVSAAAAMLMARHSELIGKPQRIKGILCETATDLRRERYFQGAGMLDILRALQSV